MNKIIRFYNQNRKEFWAIVIVSIFILLLIQVLNSFTEKKLEQEFNTVKTKETSYEQQSESLISGGNVAENKKTPYANLIENFLNNCNNGNVDKAYDALSTQCKEEIYPTIEKFQKTYLNRNFSSKKTYTFQSWNSERIDTYQIKIFEDSLSTGNAVNGEHIEDYFTVINENGNYKLNISNFIMRKELNKTKEEQGINITVEKINMYKEYYTYQIKIKNNTQNDIYLDTGYSTDTVYLMNSRGIKFEALLYENNENDFIINAGQEKEITIKFAVTFREDLEIENINFDDVVTNYQEYKKDKENYNQIINFKIEL